MKILDYIILTIAVLNLTLGTMSVIEQDYTTSIAPYVMGLLLIWYVIITVRTEKRLERELDRVKTNHDKLLIRNKEKYEQFDKYQATINHWAEKCRELENLLKLKPIGYFVKTKSDVIYGVETDIPYVVYEQKGECVSIINNSLELIEVNLDYGDYIRFKEPIPFNEPQEEIDQLHICDKCSTLMLEKEKRYVCPMCKSWKKKEVE